MLVALVRAREEDFEAVRVIGAQTTDLVVWMENNRRHQIGMGSEAEESDDGRVPTGK